MFHNHLSLNIALKCMAPLVRIREIVGSYLDTQAGVLEGFVLFLSLYRKPPGLDLK